MAQKGYLRNVAAVKVTPHESCRFWVSSETVCGKRYLVDVAQMECDCPHFQVRVRKLRANGEKTICKHLRAVFLFLGNKVAQEMATKYHQEQGA